MTGARRLFLSVAALTLGLGLLPRGIQGQQGPPYTLEQVEGYLAVGLSPDLILGRVQRDCLAFRLDAETERRLRAAGAQDAFLEALRQVCYREPGAAPTVRRSPLRDRASVRRRPTRGRPRRRRS